MQLVYLWVEEYRNLENQGFNFNPKYQCHYDADKNFLSIEKIKNHKSIFHNRLSITPIIGENGAGKSSVLELIIKIGRKFTELKFKCFVIYSEVKNDKDCFFIECDLRKMNTPESNIELDTDWTEVGRRRKNYLINHKHSRLDRLIKNHITEQSELNTFDGDSGYLFKYMELYQKCHEILDNAKNNTVNAFIFNTFTLNFKEKDFDFLEEKDTLGEKEIILGEDIKSLCEEIIVKISNGLYKFILNKNPIRPPRMKVSINNIPLTKEAILTLNAFLFLVDFFRWIIKTNTNGDLISYLKDQIKEILLQIKEESILNFHYLEKLFSDDDFNNLIKNIDYPNNCDHRFNEGFAKLKFIHKYIDKFNYHESNSHFYWELSINKNNRYAIDEICKLNIITEEYDEFINFTSFSLFNKNKNTYYNDFSSGEQELFKVFVDTIYYPHLENDCDIVILAEEFDNFLHPIWKTQLIKMMVDIFELYFEAYPHISNHIHLIFTTHSPFLISDIPIENIIFMKNGQQVQSLNQEIQTFGANIHALLTHGFFMQDGLMGCFARSKIDDLIKKINKKDEMSQEEMDSCEYLISIIGEPIIKRQLQRMLDRRRLSKVDQIDQLREEMNQIREKIAKLENSNGKN